MPIINVMVSCAMHDAVKRAAKLQSRPKQRVTMNDLVVGALRAEGYEHPDVLDALARGEILDVDIRRRIPATERDVFIRVKEYLMLHGCATEKNIWRQLHLHKDDAKRAIVKLLKTRPVVASVKPFDRPVVIHWNEGCTCALKLVAHLPRGWST